ncbi:hypothetical protein C8Q78DRAFT_801856 [Trametes maxima]|nr:hypothetical protein C8Q78DRAFT_801856 [Trametes maxima]
MGCPCQIGQRHGEIAQTRIFNLVAATAASGGRAPGALRPVAPLPHPASVAVSPSQPPSTIMFCGRHTRSRSRYNAFPSSSPSSPAISPALANLPPTRPSVHVDVRRPNISYPMLAEASRALLPACGPTTDSPTTEALLELDSSSLKLKLSGAMRCLPGCGLAPRVPPRSVALIPPSVSTLRHLGRPRAAPVMQMRGYPRRGTAAVRMSPPAPGPSASLCH